jgi:hypothetical protein
MKDVQALCKVWIPSTKTSHEILKFVLFLIKGNLLLPKSISESGFEIRIKIHEPNWFGIRAGSGYATLLLTPINLIYSDSSTCLFELNHVRGNEQILHNFLIQVESGYRFAALLLTSVKPNLFRFVNLPLWAGSCLWQWIMSNSYGLIRVGSGYRYAALLLTQIKTYLSDSSTCLFELDHVRGNEQILHIGLVQVKYRYRLAAQLLATIKPNLFRFINLPLSWIMSAAMRNSCTLVWSR